MRVRGNLVNETIWKEWEETPLPGEVLSMDEQCKVRWGNNSVQCDPTGNGDVRNNFIRNIYVYMLFYILENCHVLDSKYKK